MMQAAQKGGVQVVSGTNLPMLLEAVMSRDESSTAQDICGVAVEAGQTGVAHAQLPTEDLGADGEEEDGI
jgi:PTS system N-acetylgalactosamine-specific IIA component